MCIRDRNTNFTSLGDMMLIADGTLCPTKVMNNDFSIAIAKSELKQNCSNEEGLKFHNTSSVETREVDHQTCNNIHSVLLTIEDSEAKAKEIMAQLSDNQEVLYELLLDVGIVLDPNLNNMAVVSKVLGNIACLPKLKIKNAAEEKVAIEEIIPSMYSIITVSYTHLTLPTICSV
eukprot:TRINITY_DN13596_c0_g1_i1.p2 TRINITY_DN13596_c0_g1~~TRINITY_DN13596_c0_g1_i1.p2  ORF type:complete len:175 (+),score=37.92 TRINITY_DN13596_c0_g1_i1:79-603(+)